MTTLRAILRALLRLLFWLLDLPPAPEPPPPPEPPEPDYQTQFVFDGLTGLLFTRGL